MLEFNPRNRKVEYLATSGTDLMRRVRVSCVPVDSKTEVSVAYVVTSMSPAGAARAAHYDSEFINGWRELVQAAVDRLKAH